MCCFYPGLLETFRLLNFKFIWLKEGSVSCDITLSSVGSHCTICASQITLLMSENLGHIGGAHCAASFCASILPTLLGNWSSAGIVEGAYHLFDSHTLE